MASVGNQLTQPEAGWRRYDDSDLSFIYTNFTQKNYSTPNAYNSATSYNADGSNLGSIGFNFIGSQLRIISTTTRPERASSITVTIDNNIIETFSPRTTNIQTQTLVYEKEGLSWGEHTVLIHNFQGTPSSYASFGFDALDIDERGELLSIPPTKPPTTGKLCNTLDEMEIGDYIVWKYNSANGYQFGGSIDGYTEIPTTGVPFASMPTTYFMFFIKVDKGLLVSDRVFYHSRSWDSLNSARAVQGFPVTISGVSGVIRSLTGGVAYADENGNRSMTNLNKGSFPTNNEWDKYIINYPKSKIQSGKSLDDVWNYLDMYTLTQDTVSNGVYISSSGTSSATVNSTFRTMRGKSGVWGDLGIRQSSNTGTDAGLRPVFEWREV
jgi:hypothetical protein